MLQAQWNTGYIVGLVIMIAIFAITGLIGLIGTIVFFRTRNDDSDSADGGAVGGQRHPRLNLQLRQVRSKRLVP